jgi:hypothetical protein
MGNCSDNSLQRMQELMEDRPMISFGADDDHPVNTQQL